MKKIIALAMLAQYAAQAQKVSYSLSDEFDNVKKYTYEECFYKFDEGSYCDIYCRNGKSVTLQFFNKSFGKLINQVEVPLPTELKNYSIWKFTKLKNKYFLLCHNYEKKRATMLAYEFDPKALSFAPNPIKLIDTENIGNYSYYKFDISKDQTKVLIWFVGRHSKANASKNKENISFNTYDENLQKIYSGDIEMPYTDKDMNIVDCKTDYKGDIYALISVFEANTDGENTAAKNGKSSTRFELLKVNQKQNDLGFIKIALESKYIWQAQLVENPDKDMVITGYYSNKNSEKNSFFAADKLGSHSADGVYFYKAVFDESGKLKDIVTSYTEFPLDMLTSGESEKMKSKQQEKEAKGELEQNNLELREVIFNADGSMTVVGEEYFYTESIYTVNNKQYTEYTYFYKDILVVKTDKNGKMLWHQKIKKYQSGSGKRLLSFNRYGFNDNSYFTYMNNIPDPELKNKVPEGKLKGSLLTIARLDANGNVTKDLLYIDDENVELKPRYFENIETGILVERLSAGKKTSKILKLEFK